MAVTLPTGPRLSQPVKLSLPRRRSPSVPRTSAERAWIIGSSVMAALVLLVGYVLFIGPQRSTTTQVKSQTAAEQQRVDQLRARIDVLRSEYPDLPKYESDLAAAHAALPTGSGVPTFLRTLQRLGTATSATVSAVTVGAPTAVTPSTTASPTTPAPAASIYAMTIGAQVSGSTSALNAFLGQLQRTQPRAVLITSLTEAQSTGITAGSSATASGSTTLALTMLAFLAPA